MWPTFQPSLTQLKFMVSLSYRVALHYNLLSAGCDKFTLDQPS